MIDVDQIDFEFVDGRTCVITGSQKKSKRLNFFLKKLKRVNSLFKINLLTIMEQKLNKVFQGIENLTIRLDKLNAKIDSFSFRLTKLQQNFDKKS